MSRLKSGAAALFGLILIACGSTSHWQIPPIENAGDLQPPRYGHNRGSSGEIELGRRDGIDGHPDGAAVKQLTCAATVGPNRNFCNIEFTILFDKQDPRERVAFQVQDAQGTPLKTVYLQDKTIGTVTRVFFVGIPCAVDLKPKVRTWIEKGTGNIDSNAMVKVIRATCEQTDRTNEKKGTTQPTLYNQQGQALPRP